MNLEQRQNSKSTIYVGGLSEDVNEEVLIHLFSTFGDIIDVQLPGTNDTVATHRTHSEAPNQQDNRGSNGHRGFAFITFGSPTDAKDAIDNMDSNEVRGKVIKVNLARAMKTNVGTAPPNRAVWDSEEWLKAHGTKPVEGKASSKETDSADAVDDEEVSPET